MKAQGDPGAFLLIVCLMMGVCIFNVNDGWY